MGARRDTIARAALTRLVADGARAGEVRGDLPVAHLVVLTEAFADGLLAHPPPPGTDLLSLVETAMAVWLDGLRVRHG